MANKVLWVVTLSDEGEGLADFLATARAVQATAVAVRTTADNFDEIIPAFHDAEISVFGWRWPSTDPDTALQQARDVVKLMQLGLDGFIVDPERSDNNPRINWDQPGLEDLARRFCSTIRDAFPHKLFGTTSHYKARRVFPQLPWEAFFEHSDKLYPQAYWRMQTAGGPRSIGTGQPRPNYLTSLQAWAEIETGGKPIVPMAGEIALVTDAEIAAYAQAAEDNHVDELHFYTFDQPVPSAVIREIGAV